MVALAPMRFIVTGGCGFIGAAVVRVLVERGDRVLNIDCRPRTARLPALAAVAGRPGYARLEADMADRALMRAVFCEFGPERVIHLAAPARFEPEALFNTDLAGAFSILEACRHHLDRLAEDERDAFRIVQAVRGPRKTTGADIGLAPFSAADATATAGATLTAAWCRAHGLPLVSCHAGAVFGPWQSTDSLLSRLLASLLACDPFELGAAGATVRDWLPVRDFARGLIASATAAPMSRYEFSAGAERSDADIAAAVCTLMDDRAPRPDGAPWHDLVRLEGAPPLASAPMLDPSSAEADLGWTASSFHESLDRLVAWAVSSQPTSARAAVAA
ncbi:MAG: NAD-dependent epimerase/dehydratase family protein [Alphaproteobacteria bacterium]|nr:NAD-dependent epimerase/dehydratase family protein [Alphaproteobacteria bacterium]